MIACDLDGDVVAKSVSLAFLQNRTSQLTYALHQLMQQMWDMKVLVVGRPEVSQVGLCRTNTYDQHLGLAEVRIVAVAQQVEV